MESIKNITTLILILQLLTITIYLTRGIFQINILKSLEMVDLSIIIVFSSVALFLLNSLNFTFDDVVFRPSAITLLMDVVSIFLWSLVYKMHKKTNKDENN